LQVKLLYLAMLSLQRWVSVHLHKLDLMSISTVYTERRVVVDRTILSSRYLARYICCLAPTGSFAYSWARARMRMRSWHARSPSRNFADSSVSLRGLVVQWWAGEKRAGGWVAVSLHAPMVTSVCRWPGTSEHALGPAGHWGGHLGLMCCLVSTDREADGPLEQVSRRCLPGGASVTSRSTHAPAADSWLTTVQPGQSMSSRCQQLMDLQFCILSLIKFR